MLEFFCGRGLEPACIGICHGIVHWVRRAVFIKTRFLGEMYSSSAKGPRELWVHLHAPYDHYPCLPRFTIILFCHLRPVLPEVG